MLGDASEEGVDVPQLQQHVLISSSSRSKHDDPCSPPGVVEGVAGGARSKRLGCGVSTWQRDATKLPCVAKSPRC